jgi:hypothetical protein
LFCCRSHDETRDGARTLARASMKPRDAARTLGELPSTA